MDFERKQLKDWLPWLIAVLVFGLFLLQWYLAYTRVEDHWNSHLREMKRSIDAEVLAQRNLALKQASVIANLVAQDSEIVRIIQEDAARHLTALNTPLSSATPNKPSSAPIKKPLDATDLENTRRALHLACKPYWATLSKLGAHQLIIFGVNDGEVLYRAHSVDRNGDKLSLLRPMVSELFKSNRAQEGVDLGRHGSAYRSIVPVFDVLNFGGKAVGAVEVGFNLMPNESEGEKLEPKLIRPTPTGVAPALATDDHSQSEEHGQAVFLNASFVNERMWAERKAQLIQQFGGAKSLWITESTTNVELIKSWQAKNVIGDPLKLLAQPAVVAYEGKHFIFSVSKPRIFNPNQNGILLDAVDNSPNDAKILIFNWRDVSEYFENFQSEKLALSIKWFAALAATEIALWLLFVVQQKQIKSIFWQHKAQLKKEHELASQFEQRLVLALASSDSGFWEWDIANNRANFSAQWRELCGLASELSAKGDMEVWLDRVHPSDKRASYEAMMRHVKGETPIFENEYRLRIADGSYRWIFTRGKVVEWSADGRAALMLGVYTDVNERKKNEIIVIRQQGALHALNEIASISALDAEEQLRRALIVGARYLGLTVGSIAAIQGNQYQTRLKVKDEQGVANPDAEALSNYFCEFTFRHQNIFAINDVAASEYVQHRAHTLNHHQAYIGVPITLKGKIFGTLSFASETQREQNFDNLDRDFMWLLTRWVSVTLERWEHHNEQQGFIVRFNKLADQLPGFLFQLQMDKSGKRSFPYVTVGVYEIFGCLPEELIESDEKLFARVHRDDIEWLEQSIETSQNNLTRWSAEFRVINRNRGEMWVQVDAMPERVSKDRVVWNGFLTDKSDVKRSEMQLRSVNELSEAIFEAANMSIISTDTSGLIKTFNRGAEHLLGYKASEVINIISPLVFHLEEELQKFCEDSGEHASDSTAITFKDFVEQMSEHQGSEREFTYRRKNGSLIAISLSFTSLRDAEHQVYGYLMLGRDITEVKRAERLKNELISTVSHALRTPLTAIAGSLGILAGGAAGSLPETAQKLLHIAQTNSQRLAHIADDLLDLETLSSGVMEIKLEPNALLPILQASLESFNTANETSNASTSKTFKVELTEFPDENVFVLVDPLRLQQIMDNYLANAKKFSAPGELIEVRVTTQFNRVRISVVDKGIGVSESFRSKLFDKFAQADDLDLRLRTGSGLGLAINKEIAERMGAQVGYEPNEAQGSIFYVECDYAESAEDLASVSERGNWTNRILLAEHDPEISELLSIMLRTYHYRVDRVQTGFAALEKIAAHHYQAVILDTELPDRDGDLLVYSIKQDVSTKRVPIILLSNMHYELQRKKILDPVFKTVEWLPKPPSIDELMTSLHRVISQSKQSKQINRP